MLLIFLIFLTTKYKKNYVEFTNFTEMKIKNNFLKKKAQSKSLFQKN